MSTCRRFSGRLTEDQIAAIRNGQAIAKAVPSRILDEIFCLARSTSMLRLKPIFGLPAISTGFASFPATWQ